MLLSSRPSCIHAKFLGPFIGLAVGLVSAVSLFLILFVHGILSLLGGTADVVSFNNACTFYIFFFALDYRSVLIILAAMVQIEVYLTVFAAPLFDLCCFHVNFVNFDPNGFTKWSLGFTKKIQLRPQASW